MINRKVAESISITDGPEMNISVAIMQCYMPGSDQNNHKSFEITQISPRGIIQTITISPQTLQKILNWGKKLP